MPCERIMLPGGIVALVRVARRPRRRCGCGSGEFTSLLCDHPKPRGDTCDEKLCSKCAVEIGADIHHCRAHQLEAAVMEPPHQSELGL